MASRAPSIRAAALVAGLPVLVGLAVLAVAGAAGVGCTSGTTADCSDGQCPLPEASPLSDDSSGDSSEDAASDAAEDAAPHEGGSPADTGGGSDAADARDDAADAPDAVDRDAGDSGSRDAAEGG